MSTAGDLDADETPDRFDNCPFTFNPDQADTDEDDVGDACEAATCGDRIISAGEECDDGNTQSGDGCSDCSLEEHCSLIPRRGCALPAFAHKSTLLIRNAEDNRHDVATWKWRRGTATSKLELSNPLSSSHYTLCIYDQSGNQISLASEHTVPPGGNCGTKRSKPCWKESKNGFRFFDGGQRHDGVRTLTLKAGRSGKAEIALTAKGSNLGPPTLPLQKSPTVIVQLQNSNGRCWETRFTSAKRNSNAKFSGQSD